MYILKINLLFLMAILVSGCDSLYRAALYIDCKANSGLKIKPYKLTAGKMNLEYSQKLTSNKTIVNVSITKGRLPKGLFLSHKRDSNIFYIKGVPLEFGEFRIAIEAYGYSSMCVGPEGARKYRLIIRDGTS